MKNMESALKASAQTKPYCGRVLIIEDDLEITEFIVIALETEGFVTRSVVSRDAASKAIVAECYDHILMDLNMPGMEAREFIQNVRRLSPWSKIYLMTAGQGIAARADKLGLSHFIGKPFDPDTLLRALRSTAP
jgi:DNA-binding response OmpR family regulator